MGEIMDNKCECGCGGEAKKSKRFIRGHQNRGSNHPMWNGGKIVDSYGYTLIHKPGHSRANAYGYVKEHILMAEKALGKSLPPKAVVHHHTPEQLIVCQDQTYHMLLHQRERALADCGHADWRKCKRCHTYDDPNNLRRDGVHSACDNEYQHNLRESKKRIAA